MCCLADATASVVLRAFADPHEQTFLRGHAAPVTCVALSSRGTFIASGDSGTDSDVVVWDVETRRELWRFTEHDGGIRVLDFSHDERLLLVIGCDNRLSVFDMKTSMMVANTELPRAIGVVTCATWGGFVKDVKRRDTDCYQFATAGESVVVWSLNPYAGVLSIEPGDSRRNVRQCLCVAFVKLPDAAGREGYLDEYVVAGTQSGDFVAYLVKANRDNPGGPPSASFTQSSYACSGGVHAIVPSPTDCATLAVGGGDGTVAIFQSNDGKWVDVDGSKLAGAVTGLAFSPCGTEILAGSSGGELKRGRCGSLAQGMVLVAANPCAALTGLSFAPDSNTMFATASADGMLRVWSIEDYSIAMQTTVHGAGYPLCLEFSIDAVISGWTNGCVHSHHASTGELLWKIKDAHPSGVTALKLARNLRFVVTGGEEGEVRVWELRQRSLVSHLKEHSARVTRVTLFDDDVHAVSCSRDKSFLTWDLRHDKRISAHTQRMGGISDIALNHDQTLVMTCGQERTISFWDLREPYPVLLIERPEQGMHSDEATSIAVSHSGSLFATGGADHVVKLWQISHDRPVLLQSNVGHTGAITGMSFTTDDRQLVSIGADGCIFVWNIFHADGDEGKAPHK